MAGSAIMEFFQRYQNLQALTDSKNELIKDILVYAESTESGLRGDNQQLLQQIRDLEFDLSADTKSRRDLQQQLQQVEARLALVQQDNLILKNNNPYVVVLIDGDGLLFKEAFIRQGMEGGKKAAYALRAAILKECHEHAHNIEVMATVYANLTGLSKAMRRDGSIDSESDLRDFLLGFTQAKASFNFVDVGHGKERADNKIKETTKWHLGNFNCRQVILGISHDAGYAPFLDELFHDEGTRVRITILEGFPTTRELAATGTQILNLTETLFRSDKLVDKTTYDKNSYDKTPAAVRNPTPPSFSPGVIGSGVPSINSVSNSANTPSTSTASTPATAPATTYARAIGNASPPPQITLPIQPRPITSTRPSQQAAQQAAAKTAAIVWNPGPRGLDPPIQVSQTALDSIKKRKESNKLCNNHYLRGPCAKGDGCCFEHKYKPTKDEINAIAFLTRLNPCANGQDCDVEDCIYGHHCPSVRDGACTHPFCKFDKEDHPPGTKLKTRIEY